MWWRWEAIHKLLNNKQEQIASIEGSPLGIALEKVWLLVDRAERDKMVAWNRRFRADFECVCSIGWLANICQIFKVLVFFSAPVFTCSLKMCLTQNHKNRKSASPQHGTNFLNWTNFIQSIWVNKLNPDKRALNQIKMTSTIEQQHQKWLTCLFSFLFVSINHASPHEKSNPFFPRCKLNSNQDLKIWKWVRWLKKIDLPCIENCQTYQLSSEAFVVRNWHVKCMQREKK